MAAEDLLKQLVEWLQNFSMQYSYLGVFLISLLGSMSIFFPIPYTVVLFTLGSIETFNPILVALASSLGAAIGEFSGYLLGLGGRKIVSEKGRRNVEFLLKIFGRYGALTIFIFALTPLPDDLLFIPLGVMRYGFLRAFIPAFLGKLCMSLIIVYSGRFMVGIIRDIFGIESDWTSAIIGTVIALILLTVVFILMFKVDWEKTVEKYAQKTRGGGAIENKNSRKPFSINVIGRETQIL
ncbi:MAG: VTT domain-containing protein [Candidatus Bathyarchaeia archaeon]|nr:VTT domain-containing protein [Candidatus Bathyarchaeota archaeon]